MPRQKRREARRHRSVRHHEHLLRLRRQRKLVQKHQHVCRNQHHIDKRKISSRINILQRNHSASVSCLPTKISAPGARQILAQCVSAGSEKEKGRKPQRGGTFFPPTHHTKPSSI